MPMGLKRSRLSNTAVLSSSSYKKRKKDSQTATSEENKLLSLFESGLGSDVEVRCQGEKWACHKAILAAHSTSFENAFYGGLREVSSGHIDMNNDDPQTLDTLLQYIYGPSKFASEEGSLDPRGDYGDHVQQCVHYNRLYALADKYRMDDLMTVWETCITHFFYYLGDHLYPEDETGDEAMVAFIDAIKLIYEVRSELLTDLTQSRARLTRAVMEVCAPRREMLMNKSHIFRDYLKENPGFAIDLLEQCSIMGKDECCCEFCAAIFYKRRPEEKFEPCPECGRNNL